MATRIGRPQEQAISLTDTERDELERIARSRSAAHGLVRRAKIILASAGGETNTSIARRLGIANPTVCHWRNKWFDQGIAGLYGEARPGRPRTHDEAAAANLLRTVLKTKSSAGTHWTVRSAAQATGLSKSIVARMFAVFGLQPHRAETFKLSTDPLFVEKVRDVVGLYVAPPERAIVLCVDEKSQIQALDRSQPLLPMRPGQVERRAHDYVRHGVTSLFAALDIATGRVIGKCYARHRSAEFRRFLDRVESAVPDDLDVHVVMDNCATHKTKLIRDWFAKRPRWRAHLTPTGASWLNQVERFFALLTERQIKRGVHRSVTALEAAIAEFIERHNDQPKPFSWIKTADDILASIARFCARTNIIHNVKNF